MSPPEADETLKALVAQVYAQFPRPAPGIALPVLVLALLAHQPQVDALVRNWYQELGRELAPLLGEAPPDGVPAQCPADSRFPGPDWQEIAWFRLLREIFLANERFVLGLVEAARVDPATRRRLRLQARQYLEAACPANMPGANPQVLREARRTEGRSLAQGAAYLRADLARGYMPLADPRSFRVGHEIAATPGAVVLENRLCQLLQYEPRAAGSFRRPLLIVPPFINRYYILDLRASNSFVRYALSQGHQVFMISWRNASPPLGPLGMEEYLREGVLASLEAVRGISGTLRPNLLGFCIGGTLAAMACTQLPARLAPASLTLLATLLDYTEPGDLGSYVDASFVEACEREFADAQVVPGARLGAAFSSLRPRELIWQAAQARYLRGEDLPAHDFLFWNDDSVNLPGRLHNELLRGLYLENALAQGKLCLLGKRLELARLGMPAFLLAAENDHIVPWASAYASGRLLAGTIEFVLASAGHVAGVISPLDQRGRHYRVNSSYGSPAAHWFDTSRRQEGSWWEYWARWIAPRAGGLGASPRELGAPGWRPIAPAPGAYVSERSAPLEDRSADH